MTTAPDLLYGEVEEELRASVRSLLTDRCPPTSVLARCEGPQPQDPDLWRTLARELGVAGLQIPEALGGAGASLRETAVVLEELGRAVAPVPYLGSAVLATTALLGCDPAGQPVAGLLAALASGERTAALAVPLSAAPGSGFPQSVRADAGALTGRVTSVADTALADVLVVPATGPDGPRLWLVDAAGPGVELRPRTSLDLTRPLADLVLTGAPGQPAAGPDRAAAALERALLTGAGLLASEQLGVAEHCLRSTVEYLLTRRQFGRQIGSFQAVKHRLADLWLEVAGARAAARNAADVLAGLPSGGDAADVREAGIAVAVAQAHCADVAVHAAEECVQLHGGIGMTWEHEAHLYLKRAKVDQLALGTPGRHRAALADLADLPGPTG